MEIDFLAWANLAVRWLHLIAGIAWIGASFYFVWLDNSLRAPKPPKDGVGGDVWAVHGGGFYHNQKYLVAPPDLPEELHWFKWEAYTTWLSGFALMIIVYYIGADLYLIDRAKIDLTQWQAIAIGLGSLAGGWLVYDFLCKSPISKNQSAFGVIWFVLLTVSAYLLTLVFSDRGAFLHVGALIGTVMAANVFFVIIPNQRKTVAAMIAGEKPDPTLGAKGKQRSVHNNYMTLPVLLIMISGHYPMLVGHRLNWLLLAAISVAALLTRHYFNLRNQGTEHKALLAGAAAVFVATMGAASIKPTQARTDDEAVSEISFSDVRDIIDRHCIACHSVTPSHDFFDAPPKGLTFDSEAEIKRAAGVVYDQTVATNIMPLGNETAMTIEERTRLGAWIKQEGLR